MRASSKARPLMREVLAAASAHLERTGVPSARVDAELLACHVCRLPRSGLLILEEFPNHLLGAFWELIERRGAREPLQHLTGSTGFRHLDLRVRPGVFIPRPETEVVADVGIEAALWIPAPARLVDLCCGAGGIAVSMAQEVPGAEVWAIDSSPAAVELAKENAGRHGREITAVHGDVRDPGLLADLAGRVDVIVSNPPYIPFGAEPIDPEVREYDPPAALYGGGGDGLEIPGAVVERARELLRPGGLLVVEHSDEQGSPMRDLLRRGGGFTNVHTRPDLAGRDRMVVAFRAEVAH